MESYNTKIATKPNVEMVHISLERGDGGNETALKWAKKESFPWPTVLPSDKNSVIFKDTEVRFVPTYVLFDKDGNEIVRGKDECFEKIKGL